MQIPRASTKADFEAAICCHVHALATLRADQECLDTLRRNPGNFPSLCIPPTFLKYADDQSVAALVVVVRALGHTGKGVEAFNAWAVVASGNFFGRTYSAHLMQRYVREGAWGITPHTVPHHSLHAISGTLSQAFNLQGPNYGLGGGPRAESEALLAAAPYVADPALPGVWLVMTGHYPEQVPVETEEPQNSPAEYLAVALALSCTEGAPGGARLIVAPAASSPAAAAQFSLVDFVLHLETRRETPETCWRLPWGGFVAWQG